MKDLKLAIVWLGNCASSLLQGIEYYKNVSDDAKIVGIMHNNIEWYTIGGIKPVAIFDCSTRKIGKPVSEAVWEAPNCTKKFSEVTCPVIVSKSPVLDWLSNRMRNVIPSNADEENTLIGDYDTLRSANNEDVLDEVYVNEELERVIKELKESGAEVLISYLPVWSYHASRFWATACIRAGVAFVNAIPEFICSTEKWANRFADAWLPCAWDDIKSQIGATIVHRVLTALVDDRWQHIDNTYQLNIGGNTDFQNMLDEHRLISKRRSKTEAVTSQIKDYDLETKIGPSDYISYLDDNKICYIEMKGKQFWDIPFQIDLKMSVEDSPNSAWVMVDAIRLVKIAKDRGLKGYQDFSSYFFKHPMEQFRDDIAKQKVENFINKK